MKISESSNIQRNPDLFFNELDGEVVLLSVESGKYYKIDELGSEIWSKIEQPVKIADLCLQLLEEYEVSAEQCYQDVIDFVQKLKTDKLIFVTN